MVFLEVGLVPRGLGNWIRHQSVPEITDRDSAQRSPRRNPHACVHVGARLGVPHRARLGRDGRGGREGQRSYRRRGGGEIYAGNAVDT